MNHPGSYRRHYFISTAALILARSFVMLGGFGAVVLLAARFGATADVDAYFIARMIPVTLVSPLAISFNRAFVPVYMRTLTNLGRADAAHLASSFLNITLLASVMLTVIYTVFADAFIAMLAPGFPPGAHDSAVWMTRIMALAVVLTSLHAVLDSVLNAERRFVASALSSLAVPAGALFGVLVLADFWGITGVAFGVVLGFVLQGATLAPIIRQYFIGHRWSLGRDSSIVREAMKNLGLTVTVITAWQINTVVERMFASLLGEGTVSALSLGIVFIGLVPVLVAAPVYKVLYPELIRLVNEGRNSDLRRLFSENFVMVAFVTFPVAAALVTFSDLITELVFGYGQFSGAAVSQTAEVISYRALALPGGMANFLLIYYLLAARRTGLIVKMAVATVVANALVAWILMRLMGVGGIALAHSLITLVRTIMLAVIARRLLGGSISSNLALPLTKTAAAAAAATAAMYAVARLVPEANGSGTPIKLLVAAIAIAIIGAAVYLLGNLVLRNERLWLLLRMIRQPRPSPKESLSDAGGLDRHY